MIDQDARFNATLQRVISTKNQSGIICSKSTIETIEQGAKYV